MNTAKQLFMAFVLCIFAIGLNAQDSKTEITVVKIDKNGEKTEETMTRDGEVDVEELVEELGLDEYGNLNVNVNSNDGMTSITIEASNEGGNSYEEKKVVKKIRKEVRKERQEARKAREKKERRVYKIKKKDSDGGVKVIEWNGDGEMPEELEEILEEDEEGMIFIAEGEDPRVIKIEKEIDMDHDGSKQIIIKKVGPDGDVEVIEWDGEGEKPEGLEDMDIQIELDDDMIWVSAEDKKMHKTHKTLNKNKATMGVMIEDTDDGVKVMEVMSDSPAEKEGIRAGDIITNVEGKHIATSNGLIKSLSPYKPGDKVKVKYVRNGKEKKVNIKLAARS